MTASLVLIGGGDHARVVLDAARSRPELWSVIGFVDRQPRAELQALGVAWLGDDATAPVTEASYVVAIGGVADTAARRRVAAEYASRAVRWATVVHASAVISEHARLGPGAAVLAGAVVNTGASVGAHAIVNTGAIVEHDVVIEELAHVGPGVAIGGGAVIAAGAYLGLGARVRDHIRVGAGAVVGMGAVVVSPVADGAVVVGVPARPTGGVVNPRLPRTQIGATATITDAMRSLEVSQAQIVLVVDPDGRLLGILTDGDLRRALLAGASLSSAVAPYMNAKYFAVPPTLGRAEVLEVMQARQISQVPVVDADRRATGLHLLHEMLAVAERPNRAVIMAGGKGTRLAPLTDRVPKPMLKIAGRPILERIVLHLVGAGIRHVYLSVGHLAETIETHFGDGRGLGCRIEYLREQVALGTGGALTLLPERPAHPLVVMNGDLVTQADVGRMLDHHNEGGHAVTMGVCKYLHKIPFGCVETRDGCVVAMEEKPMTSHLINAGIYVIDPARLDLLRAGEAISMPEVVQRIMDAGGTVQAHEIDDDWIDVGRRDELDRARGPR